MRGHVDMLGCIRAVLRMTPEQRDYVLDQISDKCHVNILRQAQSLFAQAENYWRQAGGVGNFYDRVCEDNEKEADSKAEKSS